ncbi:MAG: YCF48-related protein, partial [Candidatus Cloacimonadaceae bacterium]|nr:YCF48-related protein [Candidatus Cloacimonadaceae bacterium]
MKRIIPIIVLIAICSAAYGWDILRQAQFPANLYSMDKVEEHIWAVGSGGAVARSLDDGITWEFVPNPGFNADTGVYRALNAVDFISPTQGLIVGDSGTIGLTTDGGATWIQPATFSAVFGTTAAMSCIYLPSGKIWVAGYSGMIAHSPDHGVTWLRQAEGLTTSHTYGVTMNEDGVGFITVNKGTPAQSKIMVTSDFGDTWTIQNLTITGNPTLYRIYQQGDTILMTGDAGYIGVSNDNGVTWIHHPNAAGTTTSDAMRGIILDGNIGYAVGRNSRLLKTTDGWTSFTILEHNFTQYFEGITKRGNGDLIVCGWQGGIATSSDGGFTWLDRVPNSFDLFSASFIDNNAWYISGDKGYLLKTTDGGASFDRVTVPGELNPLYACYFKNANEGWVSGKTSGVIYRTTNGGNTWTTFTIPGFAITKAYYEFFFLNDLIGYVMGVGGKVAKTTDGGITWTATGDNINTAYNLYCTYWKSELVGLAGSGSGRLYKTENGGVTWTEMLVGNAVNIMDIWFRDDNHGVMVNAAGQIFYTTTGGMSAGSWIAATESALDDMNGVWCDANGIWWAAGYSSDNTSSNIGNSWSLLKSVDDGATWTQESFPPLTFNSTRFMGIGGSDGRLIAYGKNNVIVANVQAGTPGHVVLTAPADNSSGIDPQDLMLQWNPPATGGAAAYYEVYLSDSIDELFSSPIETANPWLDASTLGLAYATRWFWGVIPVSAELQSPDPLDDEFMIWSFYTMDDPMGGIEAPITSIQRIGNSVRLSWLAVDNAISYKVYGSTDPYAGYTLQTTTNALEYIVTAPLQMEYFKV